MAVVLCMSSSCAVMYLWPVCCNAVMCSLCMEHAMYSEQWRGRVTPQGGYEHGLRSTGRRTATDTSSCPSANLYLLVAQLNQAIRSVSPLTQICKLRSGLCCFLCWL